MNIDFQKGDGLVPVIIQDFATAKVLMLGYMNEAAFAQTKEEGKVTFFSRSKNRLWTKGEESGNFLMVKDIRLDCDRDTLLIKVDPVGPVCHTGADTCWDEKNDSSLAFIDHLRKTIHDRIAEDDPNSYTNKLVKRGINKVAQKVGEEAVEVVIEAKDDNAELFLNESADLLYHYLVLLEAKGHSLEEVADVLRERHK
ncbi:MULTISPECIES: bifunctional phosphoribosyl-AMP cyclohydrolase/phosphoribosyl-ATP diphosphatase HisIE [Persicobacter]|uniref:Histidine biosynthesis bifunctional protein HisIE n=1 Tax=Persicobacter diffluens TaxID=981 RepID=A0AAN5AJI5_9BACT|nr:bifunctional phosphoribosyl-AMP cyclohydrolase/phosphoribosyl-ATP diphosphatase HisIE [Persicobacter sp. CCB-QB2]GJM61074.1 histidine biosynthesis bifunctional protein HisIE [Persicobacter diffluens]